MSIFTCITSIVLLGGFCFADPCTELDSLRGLNAGSYSKNSICHALFWNNDSICTNKAPNCPTRNPLLVSEAVSLLRNLIDSSSAPANTSAVDDDPMMMRFVVLGDVGHASSALKATAAMVRNKISSHVHVTAALLLGDNFYPRGIESGVTDPQFTNVFENIIAPSLNAPFHVLLGNHDWMGDIRAQIEYSRINPKWNLPSEFYFQRFQSDIFSTCVWFLDTEHFSSAKEQINWLSNSLAAESPSCTWKIVGGHHPIFDVGEYRDTSKLVESLLPILESFKVNLYLSGHEHQSQVMFNPALSSVTFLVCGITSERRSNKRKPEHPYFVWSNTNELAFVELIATPQQLVYNFHSSLGDQDAPPMYTGRIFPNI